jgi:hypothetical protein
LAFASAEAQAAGSHSCRLSTVEPTRSGHCLGRSPCADPYCSPLPPLAASSSYSVARGRLPPVGYSPKRDQHHRRSVPRVLGRSTGRHGLATWPDQRKPRGHVNTTRPAKLAPNLRPEGRKNPTTRRF